MTDAAGRSVEMAGGWRMSKRTKVVVMRILIVLLYAVLIPTAWVVDAYWTKCKIDWVEGSGAND